MKKCMILSCLIALLAMTGPVAAIPAPLINLNAENLPEGELDTWVNEGTLACVFMTADREGDEIIDPNAIVQMVAGRKAVTFEPNSLSGRAWFQSDITTPAALTGANPWSLLVWAYAPTTTSEDCLFQWGDRGDGAAHFNFGTRAFTNFFNDVFYLTAPPTNQWVHLAMTYDGTNIRIYVNGMDDVVAPRAMNIAAGHYMRIARSMPDLWGTHPFGGSIASIKMYDATLTKAEIQQVDGVFEVGSIGPTGLFVVEGGATADIVLQINTNPLTGLGPQEDLEVTLSIVSTLKDVMLGDSAVGEPYVVTVPAAAYQTPITITVTAEDDNIVEPLHNVRVRAMVTGGDPDYVGKILSPLGGLAIQVIDNDNINCPMPPLVNGAYRDNFDCPRDYLATGTDGSMWSGLLNNGDTAIEAAASMVSQNVLRLSSSNSAWGGASVDGPFLYVDVTGDFDVETYIADYADVTFNYGGLMVRLADPAAGGAGEDNIQLCYFPLYSIGNILRMTNNGALSEPAGDRTMDGWDSARYFKISRRGANFYLYNSFDGVTWYSSFPSATPENPLVREDMNVETLQVGLWHATFSTNEGYIEYGHFALKSARGETTGQVYLNEGDSKTVQFQLYSGPDFPAPFADIEVTLWAENAAGADPNSDPNAILVNAVSGGFPTSFILPAETYDQPTDILVTAVLGSAPGQDHLLTLNAEVASADPNWNGLFVVPKAAITVFKTPGLYLDTTDQVVVMEGGDDDVFTVRLKVEPASLVEVSVDDTAATDQVSVWPSLLYFDQTNWKIPQVVTVSAIDDEAVETDPHYTTLSLTSPAGAAYAAEVAVTIFENNCGAWGYLWADITGNCQVDIEDLAEMAVEWLYCSRPNDPECIDYR